MKWDTFWDLGHAWFSVDAKDGLRAEVRHGDAGVGVQVARSSVDACVGLTLDPDDEDALRVHAGVWPLPTVYVSTSGRAAWRLARRLVGDEGREVRVRLGEDESVDRVTLSWSIGGRTAGWSCEDPSWQQGSWAPFSALFGEATYEREVLATESDIEVLMPEGSYRLSVTLTRDVWRRPRWPGAWMEVRRATVSAEGGIPIPGKGEDVWNCGDCAMRELTTPAENIGEAVQRFVMEVHRKRFRHGGARWRPEATNPTPQEET